MCAGCSADRTAPSVSVVSSGKGWECRVVRLPTQYGDTRHNWVLGRPPADGVLEGAGFVAGRDGLCLIWVLF